jgi:type IV secretion system protein VirB6
MGAPTLHIFEDVFTYVDAATQQYFLDGAAAVASAFQGVAHSMLILYVTLWGWAMLRGMIQEPVMDGVARMLKAMFIITFATNSAIYASYVSTFLYDWPAAMAGILAGGVVTNTTQLIDHIAGSGLDLASQAWQTASLANIGGYVVSAIIFVMTLVITAITATIIISAKYGLALLLAIGPVFILMLMFEGTRAFFDKWLSVVVTSGFTIVLVSGAAALIFKYYSAAFDAASADATANGGVVTLTGIAPATVAGIIAVFFIMGIPHLAAGLGGGVSSATAGAVGWAYDKIRGAAPATLRTGRAAYGAGRAAYGMARGTAGRFGRGQGEGGSIQGKRPSAPLSVYRKITTTRVARAA